MRNTEKRLVALQAEDAAQRDCGLLATTDQEVAVKYNSEEELAAERRDSLPEGGPTTRHRQVPIAWKGRYAEVDEELAPLILSLWKAGIRTCNSCQENFPGVVWVEFPTMFDAKRFLDLVAVYPDESAMRVVNDRLYVGGVPFWETLYGRITGCGSAEDWQYDVNVHNWGVAEDIIDDEVVETCVGPSDFEFFVSVRFPRTDLPLILERLQAGTAPRADSAVTW